MTKNKAHTGFVGLGQMGCSMASNLINKGNKIVAYDVNPQAVEALVAKGAQSASSPCEVAKNCDVVFTMVPTCTHVKEVYKGKNGLLESEKSNLTLVDCSTIHPETSKEVYEACKAKGVEFIDAPVSGAVPAAIAATLTFMVGGSAQTMEKVKPLFLAMGKNVIHCGDIGSGEVAKICNNMLLGISMLGTSEALSLAQSYGLSAKLMSEIINISSGRSWVSEIYNPVPGLMENVPAAKNYEGGFKVELITKDLGLADSLANKKLALTPLGTLTYNWYKTLVNNGLGSKDFSMIYQAIAKK
jgi:3-hydroxyisobutyrate dehydrogenase